MQSIAEVASGLCLVHLSLIFAVPIQQFGIVFFLQAISGAVGSMLNVFNITRESYEKQLITSLTVLAVVIMLCPWFNFVTYCTLIVVAGIASSYAIARESIKLSINC